MTGPVSGAGPLGARAAVFAPLQVAGRAALVTERLTDGIALGLLRDGEQLPSETDLSERLGVATTTVREALATLREQGLVETRRGRGGGSFVRSPGDPTLSVLRARLRRFSPADFRDLCDHYAAVAGTAARLAADRADEDDVRRATEGADALVAGADVPARRRAEGRFHAEVAAAAQSPRLTREEIALQTQLGPLLWLPYSDPAVLPEADRDHRDVLAAVRAGDGGAARAATEGHVARSRARVLDLHLQLRRAR